MVSVTLKITNEFKTLLDKLPWVNWSEIAREEAIKKIKEEEDFKKFITMLKNRKEQGDFADLDEAL